MIYCQKDPPPTHPRSTSKTKILITVQSIKFVTDLIKWVYTYKYVFILQTFSVKNQIVYISCGQYALSQLVTVVWKQP